MQRLDPLGVYSDAEVKAALSFAYGTRSVTFRFDRHDSANRYLGPLGSVLAGSVSNNALADLKRVAKFTVKDDGSLDYLKDRVKPWARLAMPDGGVVEWPLGVFLLATPSRKLVDGLLVVREVDAYDQLLVLMDDKTATRYAIAAGVKYTDAIKTVADLEGIAVNLTPSALVLPAAMEWAPGASYLRIVNDLLGAINYDSAWFDENGLMVVRPYLSPQVRTSEFTYATDADSVIAGDVDQTLDLFGVPNKWVLVKSEPDLPALVGTYTNTAPGSPTSTVSRGRTIVEVVSESDAADQLTLDAKAARLAFESSQVYEVVQFSTALMPMHGNADVYTLTLPELAIGAKYSEHEWSMSLDAGATMSHKVRRVVNV